MKFTKKHTAALLCISMLAPGLYAGGDSDTEKETPGGPASDARQPTPPIQRGKESSEERPGSGDSVEKARHKLAAVTLASDPVAAMSGADVLAFTSSSTPTRSQSKSPDKTIKVVNTDDEGDDPTQTPNPATLAADGNCKCCDDK